MAFSEVDALLAKERGLFDQLGNLGERKNVHHTKEQFECFRTALPGFLGLAHAPSPSFDMFAIGEHIGGGQSLKAGPRGLIPGEGLAP